MQGLYLHPLYSISEKMTPYSVEEYLQPECKLGCSLTVPPFEMTAVCLHLHMHMLEDCMRAGDSMFV